MNRVAKLIIGVLVVLGLVLAFQEAWYGRYNDGYKNGLGVGMSNRC